MTLSEKVQAKLAALTSHLPNASDDDRVAFLIDVLLGTIPKPTGWQEALRTERQAVAKKGGRWR